MIPFFDSVPPLTEARSLGLCLRELVLGPERPHGSCTGGCVPLTSPLLCFFTGKRGFGGAHVLPLLPAHSGPAHPHCDQVSEPQSDGHHRLLRYLSCPCGLARGLPAASGALSAPGEQNRSVRAGSTLPGLCCPFLVVQCFCFLICKYNVCTLNELIHRTA